jgi:DNA-binding response OmpR family regulator
LDAGGGAILIVEDDDRCRTLISTILEEAGYATREASSGNAALELARRTRPPLVILDVHLPDLSGYEVCRALRAELGSTLPILFVSGERTESFDRVAGLLVGGDDYVVKPFANDELLARVMSLLRRSSVGRSVGTGLTERELEVLRLLSSGASQVEIARKLLISPKTVGGHLEHIFGKLGVHSRAEAVAHAYREGLVDSFF